MLCAWCRPHQIPDEEPQSHGICIVHEAEFLRRADVLNEVELDRRERLDFWWDMTTAIATLAFVSFLIYLGGHLVWWAVRGFQVVGR